MAIMDSVSHAPSSSNAFNTILPMTLFVLDFPLEIAADTIILPVDLWLYGYYCRNHPLDRHLYSNDLEGLEKKLKKGVSPNVISPWFMKRQPLLCQAYWNHNETAYLFIGFQFKKRAFVPKKRPSVG